MLLLYCSIVVFVFVCICTTIFIVWCSNRRPCLHRTNCPPCSSYRTAHLPDHSTLPVPCMPHSPSYCSLTVPTPVSVVRSLTAVASAWSRSYAWTFFVCVGGLIDWVVDWVVDVLVVDGTCVWFAFFFVILRNSRSNWSVHSFDGRLSIDCWLMTFVRWQITENWWAGEKQFPSRPKPILLGVFHFIYGFVFLWLLWRHLVVVDHL